MRIALVNDSFSSSGGGQHRIQNMGAGLKELGHEVTYICPYGMSSDLSALDLSKIQTRPSNYLTRFLAPYFNEFFLILPKLHKIKNNCDFVIIELPNTMSKALHSIPLKIDNLPTAMDFAGLWTSRIDRNVFFENGRIRFIRPVAQLYEDFVMYTTSRLPQLITVATSQLGNLLEKKTRRNTSVVHHPVNTYTFNPDLIGPEKIKDSLPKRFRDRRMILLGVKGDSWFVERIEKYISCLDFSNTSFLVIGTYPTAEKLVNDKGLGEYVYFTGNVPYAKLPMYISIADFAVVLIPPLLQTLHFAPHNISKIVDYLAMGKPVITDTSAASDYVVSGLTGFICKDDMEVLDKIEQFLRYNNLSQMSKNARNYARETFDHVKVAEKYTQLIKYWV